MRNIHMGSVDVRSRMSLALLGIGGGNMDEPDDPKRQPEARWKSIHGKRQQSHGLSNALSQGPSRLAGEIRVSSQELNRKVDGKCLGLVFFHMRLPMAGYSGTPLVKKLGLASGARAAFVSAPKGFSDTLGPLPENSTLDDVPTAPLDFALLFVDRMADLKYRFAPLAAMLSSSGILWVAWPKKASKVATDVTENLVRDHGLNVGLVDVKVCAIDDVWSGLKFVYRLKDRPARNK